MICAGGGGGGGELDPASRGKKIPFHSFTMKIKTFTFHEEKTHANSAMTCMKSMLTYPKIYMNCL